VGGGGGLPMKVAAVVKEDESSCARALVAVGDAQGGCDGHPGGTGGICSFEPDAPVRDN
jgi:hypothetical protein